jgi:hypothetical protein
MKRTSSLLVAAVSFLIVLAMPVCAQSIHLTGDIPFEFSVHGQIVSAGTYTIEQRGSGGSQSEVMVVIDQARTQKALFLVQPVTANKAPDQPKLVFTRIQGRYFLSQIWTTDSAQGVQLVKSRVERELVARAPAMEKQDVIVLAMR